ncbi:MAG: PAS domain S-box protein [Desulfobulbaceae bacterium]|nr:PAS domain S-box protein [Desulfobulbaceae bacterium]
MSKRMLFTIACLLFLIFGGFLQKHALFAAEFPPVKIGVLAHHGDETARRMWDPTAEYLTRTIPQHSFTIIPLGFAELAPAVARGEVDFVLANSSIYVGLEALYGATRIATVQNAGPRGGTSVFGGVIFCRADRSDLHSLAELRGKSFLAVDKTSLGGWQVAWRELQSSGLNPYRDFGRLQFTGTTHDDVVYAVRDGKADVGTVRTDTLERLAEKGKIALSDFRILNQRQAQGFPFVLSTRLYPEWPLAAVAHTDLELAEQVAMALFNMPHDSPAAQAGKITGWTIPLKYEPVHGLLRELHLPPYQDYGKITLTQVLRLYWHWLALAFIALLIMVFLTLHVLKLNRRLVRAKKLVEEARNGLEQEVLSRTVELQTANEGLRRNEELLRAVHENAEIGIAVIGPDLCIKSLNRRMRQWFPHIDSETKPLCYQSFNTPPRDAPCIYCPTLITMQDGMVHEAVTETPTPSGMRHYRIVSSPLLAADGSVEAAIEVVEDITELKRKEATLRMLSCVVEQSPTSIVITDPTGVIEYVNPKFCELTGYSAEEVVGHNPRILQSGNTPQEEYDRLWATILGGETFHGEFCNKKKGGELYWESATVAAITDDAGAITHFVAIKEDITLRKEAANALRRSEERLNAAQRIAHIGSWELDLLTNTLVWSAEIYRIFEIDSAEFGASYDAFLNVVHPDDREMVNAVYTNSLVTRTPYVIEHRLLLSDSKIKYVREQCETVHGADGKPLRSIGTVQDVTELKQIENDLRYAKEEWERTFDAISDPVMILDSKHRIIKANKAMADALGVTSVNSIGMTCYEAVHGTKTPPDHCPHARLLADGQARSQEIYEPRLGGHFLVNVSPLHAPDGTLVGSIHSARDISTLKKIEEISRKYALDLEKLLAISRETTSATNIEGLYRSFVLASKELLDLDFSSLLLLSEDKKRLTVRDCLGFSESMIGKFSLIEGQGLSYLAVNSKRVETVFDFTLETRFEAPPIVNEKGILSAIAVPMMMQDEVIGVLIGHTFVRRDFSQQEMDIYQHIANQAAVAIQNVTNTDRLRRNEKELRDITSSLGEGVYVLDEGGKIIFMNPEAESLLGWTQAELADKNIHDVIHYCKPDGSLQSWEECPIHKVINTGGRYFSQDETFIRKDGTYLPVSVISAPVIENNQVVSSVTSFMDITFIKEAQDALNKANQLLKLQATIDPLTGIFNRGKFDEMLLVELSRARRYNLPLSLVMLDIDHFKNINDTFGHHVGDIVLKELTAHISKYIRKNDWFARWGGEEFIILLPHTTLEQAEQFAENCRVQIEELRVKGLEGITCSFGVTELTADDDIFSFNKRVDTALYRAKDKGRNRVEIA